VQPQIVAVLTSRLYDAVNKFLSKTGLEQINLNISTPSQPSSPEAKSSCVQGENAGKSRENDQASTEGRARQYKAQQPIFDFEQLVVSDQVREDLFLAVDLIQLETKVFDEWGLRQIEPFPRTALNFYGAPGTGKTLAAHAIASKIKRPILVASYAQIESMYHGEGPKNVEAIFLAAERDNALLFIDEADSLLSKRLTNVTQGSEQAINSMRSQLLICLERFRGVVIFSTNLVENYDKAFETRVRHVHFPMPDEMCRREIWRRHLPKQMPLAKDVSPERLAQVEDVCGRDIKNGVIDAAMRVARKGKECIELSDLLDSIERIKSARINVKPEYEKLAPGEEEEVQKKVKQALAKKEKET
jgi:ATP-dependent 26S proteasome regulatory subunit